jgi:hypothetical protein
MEKDGPLDGRKYNENSQDSQIGQVTPKKFKVTSDRVCNKFMGSISSTFYVQLFRLQIPKA